ncbi:Laminin subunit alpha-5 [Talaromyces islandicus]|uniref:Laminin subunit alpha-5 n=1 Tax=Talaromyces islandicus TaxID=28573 RepID=A0A0U1M657_TALIS|nr:Laminin subunit alpha-5 [Talaromyces islandicus]
MSVLRQGGSFLQRRLTKMYTDTKTSCESVATASKANDDPELVALHRQYRTQKDRLLAWGLDWSDSNAAQPNDIDESLTEAGFSDVVASVMSSIQEILNEAERLQHGDALALPRKGSAGADLPPKEDLAVKSHWTEADIKRSYTLLNDLTGCIDTLYDLSQSRRNMSMSMAMNDQPNKIKARSQTTLPKESKISSDALRSMSVDPKILASTRDFIESPVAMKQNTTNTPTTTSPVQEQTAVSNYPGFRSHSSAIHESSQISQSLSESLTSTKHLLIDRSALQLSGASHDQSPPPYEQVAASANSRIIGRIQTSATPFLTSLTKESTIPILVEFTPMMLESQNSVTIPAAHRLDKQHRALDRLVENSRVSHLGLLRFLGYYLDMANARYAFVYQMPVDYFPFLSNPSNLLKELKPKTLVSLFHSGDEQQDIPVPTLESRFRLAYNLLLAVLHLRSQNFVHGNINSNNILVFPGLKNSSQDEIGGLVEDLRRPYLTSLAQFSGSDPTPEPLSSSMYRHPDDKRVLDDEAAWAYDLYSLGLVLLEIGLWAPISRLWKMKYNNAMFKQRIENVYIKKLASKCGNAYLHVVQLCLDAPNFLLSTEPMADLSLRVPNVFAYPTLEFAEPDSQFAFSANFLYTMSKIIYRCCAIDIFSPPPTADLDDCLPLALGRDFESEPLPMHSSLYETDTPVKRNPETPAMQNVATDSKVAHNLSDSVEKKVKKRTLKKLTNVDIPQEHLNHWNFYVMPQLSKILHKILKDSSESCTASLMMTGESPETAKTTICVTCSNVKKVRAILKRYFEIEQDWDLIVLRGDVTRSKVPNRRRRKPQCSSPVNSIEPAFAQSDLNPHYQQKPLCGASIGAFINEEHLPPVSYGGAILVDGMPFGMTVHHMLEAPSDDEDDGDGNEFDEDLPRSSANWDSGMAMTNEDFAYTWCEPEPETHFEIEISDDEDDDDENSEDLGDYFLSDDDSSDEEYDYDDVASIGDTAGVDPEDEPRLVVTQPAIDDVHEDFFPTLEDRDDEHLASHSLGYVHASSGLRRWMRKGIKHEIDWALISLHDSRMDARNFIVGGAARNSSSNNNPGQERIHEAPIHLNKVARLEELSGLSVQCCGRTSGYQRGSISPAMSLVKLHGRQSFSSSFAVNGSFGVPGDSGAWVFEKSTGRVCGHVLAWSERSRTAYIAPMQVLLEDISRTLGACAVTLPGCQDDNISSAAVPQTVHTYNQRQQQHLRDFSLMSEHIPVDLSRLSLSNLEDPPAAVSTRMMRGSGAGPGAGSGRGGVGRGLRNVSTSSYRAGPPPLMTHTGGMERQLA